jgi:hypothetical protein
MCSYDFPRVRDPLPPSDVLLRGVQPVLDCVIPRFPKSDSPILFHLPYETFSRVLETIHSSLVGPAFIGNGSVSFGLNGQALKSRASHWKAGTNRDLATRMAHDLSVLVVQTGPKLQVDLLPRIIEVAGELSHDGLLHEELANRVLKATLPRCFEQKALSRADLLSILAGSQKIPISQKNAVVFPMLFHFGRWFLERNRINRSKRSVRRLEAERLTKLLCPSTVSVKEVYS